MERLTRQYLAAGGDRAQAHGLDRQQVQWIVRSRFAFAVERATVERFSW
jgi:hypothetical protein